MPRFSVIAAILLTAQTGAAQTALTVFSPDEGRPFDLSIVDKAGQSAKCTLPAAGGCHLTLSPGSLELNLQAGGESLKQTVTLPAGSSALKLAYQPSNTPYVGIGSLAGGVVFAVLSGVAFAQYQGSPQAGVLPNYAPVYFGVISAVVAAGLLVAGGIELSGGFGPHPQAEIVAAADAPQSAAPSPSAAPAPISNVPEKPAAPPPAVDEPAPAPASPPAAGDAAPTAPPDAPATP